jgi:hypothetical protein
MKNDSLRLVPQTLTSSQKPISELYVLSADLTARPRP